MMTRRLRVNVHNISLFNFGVTNVVKRMYLIARHVRAMCVLFSIYTLISSGAVVSL